MAIPGTGIHQCIDVPDRLNVCLPVRITSNRLSLPGFRIVLESCLPADTRATGVVASQVISHAVLHRSGVVQVRAGQCRCRLPRRLAVN